MHEPKPDFSNSAYLFPCINREGFKFGFAALAVAVVFSVFAKGWLCLLTIPLYLLAYGVFLFFRDPERYQPDDAKAILSPADGRVCLIQECEMPDSFGELDEFKGRKYWRVSVFMSVFNVHVNRIPTAGEILKKEYIGGKFLNASLDKASKDNERCNYLVKADNGEVYAVTQIAGLVARRIVPQVEEGQKLERIERFGLIRFGSRLDVYLPEGVRPEVRVGQIMVAGETVLGHLS
ncbi:MAG: phosphatidylserine decarboxylase [Kiritimatiellae bacterium]|nr:phosphatidylserine decarboxylase [Kiritimatiellia bacterium]